MTNPCSYGSQSQQHVTRSMLAGVVIGTATAMVLVSVGAVALLRKEVVLQVDGRRQMLQTYRTTVGEVLEEAGIRVDPKTFVNPAKSTRLKNGMEITIRHAIPVVIYADGRRLNVRTAGATVADVLAEQNIQLMPRDRVFPPQAAEPWAGARIRVVRIQEKIVTLRLPIPYRTIQRTDPTLVVGAVRVQNPGEPGFKERLIQLTYADGRLVGEKVLGEKIVKNPIDRLILSGRRFLIASRGAFAGREYVDMVATAYYPGPLNWRGGVDEITAIGLRAGRGVVAVDPRIIPLRSKLYIENYGYAIAGDTGGAIKGLRIDLGFDTYKEAIRFGRRKVRVYILERPKQPL